MRRASGLPDLPEVRALLRWSWLNGFTFGAFEGRVAAARQEAREAIRRGRGGGEPDWAAFDRWLESDEPL